MKTSEELYIKRRIIKSRFQSLPFFLFRIIPIHKNRIVVTTIEGTTGFSCNPKYIVLELLKRNENMPVDKRWQIYWLVNDIEKPFPEGVKKVRNTLFNRAYLLTTAHFWIDNSRKQLECRKRKGQIYIQTWHAKLGFKPTCLDRGASFSRIAYLVTKHDSDMIDYWLSNSDWYDNTLKTGSLYDGKTIRSGSPRCDLLIQSREDNLFKKAIKDRIAKKLNLKYLTNKEVHYIMYAPTFRGGSQSTNRSLEEAGHMPEFIKLVDNLEKKFDGYWRILLRLHPQMTVRHINSNIEQTIKKDFSDRILDISKEDDIYEYLAGCDAFMTDYSSAAFDAAVMNMPVFLYCDDYRDYEEERGKLLWNLRKLPFPLAEDDSELEECISTFDEVSYQMKLTNLFESTGMVEDGNGSRTVADFLHSLNS